MSHEWNCVCVRCERERDWLDNIDADPRADERDEKSGLWFDYFEAHRAD